jgi:hypothetical protein
LHAKDSALKDPTRSGCHENGIRTALLQRDHPILQVPSLGGAIVSKSSFGPGTVPNAS